MLGPTEEECLWKRCTAVPRDWALLVSATLMMPSNVSVEAMSSRQDVNTTQTLLQPQSLFRHTTRRCGFKDDLWPPLVRNRAVGQRGVEGVHLVK